MIICLYNGRDRERMKKAGVGARVMWGRMGRDEEVNGMVVFLESNRSACAVAQTYNVDGGKGMSW